MNQILILAFGCNLFLLSQNDIFTEENQADKASTIRIIKHKCATPSLNDVVADFIKTVDLTILFF